MANVGRFLKRNIYYLLLILCIAVIATVITLTLVNANRGGDIGVVTPPDQGEVPGPPDGGNEEIKIIFDAPVRVGEIGFDYSNTVMVEISTGNHRFHEGIDFKAEAGTDVYTAYEGVVESISTDKVNGTMIVIKHNDDLKTVYKSLDTTTSVSVGDRVRKGDIIGKVGNTMGIEMGQGDHLHFEVLENGAKIDPYVYLLASEK